MKGLDSEIKKIVRKRVGEDGLIIQPVSGSAQRAMAVALVNRAIKGSLDAIKIVRSIQEEKAAEGCEENYQIDIQVVE